MSYRGEQKINGNIYVYEATAVWNAKKQRSEQKRIYIGTKDPITGELKPNKKYYELYGDDKKSSMHSIPQIIHSLDFGNTYLLNYVTNIVELDVVLKECFPHSWEEILTCAWYSICEQEPLYLCSHFAENSNVPVVPSSQRISKLLLELDENKRMMFYKKWASLRSEKEYLALDITSISSWSELIQYVEYGYNRDQEHLPQVNLAMLFGEQSRLPVFCRIYPGSIKDVNTLKGMVTFIKELNLKQMHFVMDKGFYHTNSLELMLNQYIKFAIGVPFTTTLAKDSIHQCRNDITSPSHAIEVDGHVYYAMTLRSKISDRRVYLHVYFDEERQVLQRTSLMKKVLKLESDLIDGSISETHSQAKKYFSFHKTKTGMNVHRKEEIIQDEIGLSGYFVILTSESKDAKDILSVYRTKDVVEKSFHNLKNELDMERLRVHSDHAMEGRIFLGFLSLILMSYIRKKMTDKNMYKSYTFSSLLSELKKQKLVEFGNGHKILTELTSKQKSIYKAFDIPLPDIASI